MGEVTYTIIHSHTCPRCFVVRERIACELWAEDGCDGYRFCPRCELAFIQQYQEVQAELRMGMQIGRVTWETIA